MKSVMCSVFALFAAGSAFAGSAFAADVPSRTVPLPPVRPAFVEPQFYVGAFAGGSVNHDTRAGLNAGWQPNPFMRVEALYDYGWRNNSAYNSNSLVGNVIAQYPFGRVTPYALAGTGYRWTKDRDEAIWNVGGGLRYSITTNVEADLRYRYISNYSGTKTNDNVVTFGLNYRF